MELATNNINQQNAASAFNRQSAVFDELYSSNTIVQYKRERVREHFLSQLKPNSFILELNSGTGEDAIYFAQHGHTVHATDISEGMQQVLQKKVFFENVQNVISTELCSFTDLFSLQNKGPYDAIFSNFAGLNCTAELDKVLNSFNQLLKSGGVVTLVVMPKFCLWETLLVFKGKFKTAFRRFFSKNGRKAHIEGEYFKCWYYNPSYIINSLKNNFDVLSVEGLCTFVPPSYIEGFAKKHTKAFQFLKETENKYKKEFPWKNIGDYFIMSLQKR